MRKRKKEQILSLLQSYEEAHSTERTLIEEGKGEAAISLLVLCQEGMEKVEKDIPVKAGEEGKWEGLFTSYQESIYRVFLALSGETVDPEGARNFLGQAESVFRKIQEEVECLPVHTLILFLPYKASMWDSMASVYQAARQDPSSEALVMPITYFEKREDGSFGEPRNEREQFPKGIPLLTEDFSLEEEQPDILYIHNPYDGANRVTSVHPRYYSSNLKKYTRNLVFIPYYTSVGATSFGSLFLPAYREVDFIVTQNEAHTRSLPEEVQDKARTLGSPKLDSVLSFEKKETPLPKEWEKIAAGRKLCFYNTSLEEMLEDAASFLRKMEEVFTLFKGNREYCLLWRPHPLLENTFLTMRREFLPRFKALKQQFFEEKIGIYDGAGDLDTAVVYADLYLGASGSSIAPLFSVMEKPLFILDQKVSSFREEGDARMHDLLQYFLLKAAKGNPEELDETLVFEGRFLLHASIKAHCLYLDKVVPEAGGLSSEDFSLPADEYGEAYFDQGRWILCPKAGNHFLILEKGRKERKVLLPSFPSKPDTFLECEREGEYIFCKAENYPCDVRFSLKKLEGEELKGQKEENGIRYHIAEEELKRWKVECRFPEEELVAGFLPSRRFLYGLQETARYTLQDFLSGKSLPRPFDKAFSHSKIKDIGVHIGCAGEKIHAYFQQIAVQDE